MLNRSRVYLLSGLALGACIVLYFFALQRHESLKRKPTESSSRPAAVSEPIVLSKDLQAPQPKPQSTSSATGPNQNGEGLPQPKTESTPAFDAKILNLAESAPEVFVRPDDRTLSVFGDKTMTHRVANDVEETKEVREILEPTRANYKAIRNIELQLSITDPKGDYSLSGYIFESLTPKRLLVSDIQGSEGFRIVSIYDGVFLFAGQGDCNATISMKPTSANDKPDDALLEDVLQQKYVLVDAGDNHGQPAHLKSQFYELWIDRDTGMLKKLIKFTSDKVFTELVFAEYRAFGEGIQYPTRLRLIEHTGNGDKEMIQAHSDVKINRDHLDYNAIRKRPKTEFIPGLRQ